MTHFNCLPIELNTIIISYTLPIDYKNIMESNVINELDYHLLFRLQFEKYYFENINNYRIIIIYEDLLKVINYLYKQFNYPETYSAQFFSMTTPKIILESILKIERESYNLETVEYLTLNKLITMDIDYIS